MFAVGPRDASPRLRVGVSRVLVSRGVFYASGGLGLRVFRELTYMRAAERFCFLLLQCRKFKIYVATGIKSKRRLFSDKSTARSRSGFAQRGPRAPL